MDFRVLRCFVRGANACEFPNDAFTRLPVCVLWITLLADLHWTVYEDFNKGVIITEFSGGLAIYAIRGDECSHVDNAAVTKDLCQFADSAYILSAVFGGKTQV